MQVNPIKENSFKGIKLSSNNYERTKNIAKQLEEKGYYCLGHKTFYCNNTLSDKINLAKQIRQKAYFYKVGFGAIFLPWSKEVYLMSNLQHEQKLYSLVKEIDDGASINLLI